MSMHVTLFESFLYIFILGIYIKLLVFTAWCNEPHTVSLIIHHARYELSSTQNAIMAYIE